MYLTSMLRKAEKLLFYFLLFSIPFQTRKILWQQNWYFNEWQSVSLYATDILLLVLFAFWIFNSIYQKELRIKNYELRTADYFLLAFVAISAVSIWNSTNLNISLFSFVKLVEFAAFFFYIKSYVIYKFGFTKSLFILVFGGVFQAVVAVVQFLKQSDLGLRILGESIIGPDMSGIASFFNIYGEKVIRAYGTTPHPNIAAAYLFLAIFAFYFIWFYKRFRFEKLLLIAHGITVFALFTTFARVTVFVLFANFAIRASLLTLWFKKTLIRKRILTIIWFTALVIGLFAVFFWPEAVTRIKISGDEEAVQLRLFYGRESLESLNWFGVGTGNFVNWLMAKDPNLTRGLYQPVHNIYLLIYSETGILGIIAFVMFLFFLAKEFMDRTKLERFHHYSVMLIFSSFLFIGLFDHFLWTLQQGRFIFWLILAMLTVEENDDILKT